MKGMDVKGDSGGVVVDVECASFAMVQQVVIEAVDDKTVTYSTRAASISGAGPDGNLRKTFVTPRSEIWTQPIDGAPPPVALLPGAIGNLFLSKAGWEATTADGFQIYGAGTDLATFKYPWCAAGPRILSSLRVVPSSIVVRGHLADSAAFFELELLGPDAAPAQDVTWSSADFITVQLTARGAARLGLPAGATSARMWPTRIIVTGSPASDLSVSGEVDVLDSESAGAVQHLAWEEHGQPVALSLTLDGVSAFHVEPQRRTA
ncbi:MAG TPA: hypothetical protein VFP84_39535 [Kofleriaceae bacterium]|nr:hypothetical protein [Kofleriaceae bacterium]